MDINYNKPSATTLITLTAGVTATAAATSNIDATATKTVPRAYHILAGLTSGAAPRRCGLKATGKTRGARGYRAYLRQNPCSARPAAPDQRQHDAVVAPVASAPLSPFYIITAAVPFLPSFLPPHLPSPPQTPLRHLGRSIPTFPASQSKKHLGEFMATFCNSPVVNLPNCRMLKGSPVMELQLVESPTRRNTMFE